MRNVTLSLDDETFRRARILADRFLDTNVLLYAVSRTASEHKKREIACALLAQSGLGVSVQVLQEFYVQAHGQDYEGVRVENPFLAR